MLPFSLILYQVFPLDQTFRHFFVIFEFFLASKFSNQRIPNFKTIFFLIFSLYAGTQNCPTLNLSFFLCFVCFFFFVLPAFRFSQLLFLLSVLLLVDLGLHGLWWDGVISLPLSAHTHNLKKPLDPAAEGGTGEPADAADARGCYPGGLLSL